MSERQTLSSKQSKNHSSIANHHESAQGKILELDQNKGSKQLTSATIDNGNVDQLRSQLKSPHFFAMSGIPKFGKNWLDNFIPEEEMQNIFLASEVVRNVLMLQCVYYASLYNDLLKYKQSFGAANNAHQISKSLETSQILVDTDRSKNQMVSTIGESNPPFKIGIIGCGQLGTMILTKLLETQNQYDNLKIFVSTRQPHLLRAFQQEFGVWVDFNNEKIVAECDLIFLCILPFQAQQVLKDIRPVVVQRYLDAQKYKNMSKPLFISCLAATGIPKLKIMLNEQSVFLKTQVNVQLVKEDLFRSRSEHHIPKHNTSNRVATQQNGQTFDAHVDGEQIHRQNEIFNDMNPQIAKELELTKNLTASHEDIGSSAFQRILSAKAFQFGAESGITAEFIVKQASSQLAQKLDDLFSLFDTFQEVLYSNDPHVNVQENFDNEKAIYEESILLSILGQEYHQFISPVNGEWENEKLVLVNFYQNFEERIRFLFISEQKVESPTIHHND